MPDVEGKPGRLPRITREEMYPTVGEPTTPLQALIPTFGEEIVRGLIEGVKEGRLSCARLKLTHQGSNPQCLEVEISGPNSSGAILNIDLSGDWDKQTKISGGLPVLAPYDGKFYRKIKPAEKDPIAQEGQVLEPNDPFALAMQGKNKIWFLKLPPTDFPRGGRISLFVHPDGEDVVRGQSILLYVEPL